MVIDCSHGNSDKNPDNQKRVVDSVCETISANPSYVAGVMLESHLIGGRQNHIPGSVTYGQSITDACLSFEETIPLLQQLNETVRPT